MTDDLYLLAKDILDETEYAEDGKARYWSKYMNKRTGQIVWFDQTRQQFV